jgi:hypothetical protein
MGNALSAVITGDISAYYNPALPAFAQERNVAASFGFLSLDRTLNFLSYSQAVQPTAGIAFTAINAGVGNIDGRDDNGIHTDSYSTYENQLALAFSNRVDDRVSLGVAIKLYYSKLFDGVKSTTVGFDIGAAVRATDELTIGAALIDINSRYKWDTRSVYGENGSSPEDKFPMLRRLGASYILPWYNAVVSAEVENSSEKTTIIRAGAEVPLAEYFTVRGGFDRWDMGDAATGVKPSFGFTVRNAVGSWTPSVTYAYVAESFAPRGMHILSLATSF